MKNALPKLIAACSAVVLLGACASAPATVDGAQAASVNQFLNKWNAAVAARDKPAIRAAYSNRPDFRWHEDGALRYRSADEVVAALGQFPPETTIRTVLSDMAVLPLSQDIVSVSAAFQTRITLPQGPFEFSGVFTAVLERKGDSHAFLSGHTSSVRANTRRN